MHIWHAVGRTICFGEQTLTPLMSRHSCSAWHVMCWDESHVLWQTGGEPPHARPLVHAWKSPLACCPHSCPRPASSPEQAQIRVVSLRGMQALQEAGA